jgi:hypothetical protein
VRTLLLVLGLLLLPARARAGDGPPAGGGAQELLVAQDWGDGPLSPGNVRASARRRGHAGGFLLVAGGLGAALGTGLMIGEYVVKPGPDEQKVWSDKGCMISFGFGLIFVPTGVYMASVGAAMLARSRTLESVAGSMELTGPDPRWKAWHDESKGLRVIGNVLSLVGTGLITAALATSVPSGICRKWKCQAWPEYGPWEGWGSEPVSLSIGFGVAGAMIATLGVSLLLVGYSKQARFHDRHLPVMLAASPGGLALAW